MCVTACDLERYFNFDTTVEIIGHLRFRFMCKHILVNTCYISRVWKLERFQTAKVTFKVTQGHCHRYHSVSY